MYTEEKLNGFFEAVESLKKYRRADLVDDKGRSLLKELYTDLLPNDYILKKSLKENTTFLIGRKGTGKSTIFLRLEQELREKKGYLPCYLDVKTIYESSQTKLSKIDQIETYLPAELVEKYLIERAFLQNILSKIIDEITEKFNSLPHAFLSKLGISKVDKVKDKLTEIKNNLEDNHYLASIEIPILKTTDYSTKKSTENSSSKNNLMKGFGLTAEVSPEALKLGIKTDSGSEHSYNEKTLNDSEVKFSSIFLQVFQIKEIFSAIKDSLSLLEIKNLFKLQYISNSDHL